MPPSTQQSLRVRTHPTELHGATYDVVVIGAGIQGAALAREASVRGLSTLLLEARDVAAGTSSRSSRLVHGGLRYLRDGHMALVREALQERERLLRLAPHLVSPQPMLMPFYPESGVAPWKLRIGTWLYSRLAGRSTLPRPRRLSAKSAAEAFPGIRTKGLRSAIEFFDARTQDGRLTLANVIAAVEAGCRFVNHAEVVGVHEAGLRFVDRITGDEQSVNTACVLNAAGPAVDQVLRNCGVAGDPLIRMSRGSHLVLPARQGELAMTAFLPDERIQFVIPHDGGTLCGTTDVDDELVGNETGPPESDLDYLMEALGFVMEAVPDRREVHHAYAGWRALPRVEGPSGALNREAFFVTHPLALGAIHTVVGGKLTTHRSFAERMVAKVFSIDGPSPTRSMALPGGSGPREVEDPLWWRHGSRVQELRALVLANIELAEQMCPHRPFLIAELVHAVQNLGAVTFSDVMLRRLVHVRGPCLEDECLQKAHGWFLRERTWPVDDDYDSTRDGLLREVRQLTGDLFDWQGGGA